LNHAGPAREIVSGAQVHKNHFSLSGFLIIGHRKDLLSSWLFIIADTRKFVMKGEMHP
jgi:hypothetical protein